jgi:hypothetical protein
MSKTQENEESKLIYKVRGTGRIGTSMVHSWRATWPFAKLEFYNDRIVLGVWPKKAILKFEEIDNVELLRTIFMVGGAGIQIRHHSDDEPRFLVFWPRKCEEILSLFREKGVSVK